MLCRAGAAAGRPRRSAGRAPEPPPHRATWRSIGTPPTRSAPLPPAPRSSPSLVHGEGSQRQAEPRRKAPEQIPLERVDPPTDAQVEHLRKRKEQARLQARFDAEAEEEQRAQLERHGSQPVAPESVSVGKSDLEAVLDAIAQHRS